MIGFGFGGALSARRGRRGVLSDVSSVAVSGGVLSVNILGLPQISEPQITGGVMSVDISALPTISDIRTQ